MAIFSNRDIEKIYCEFLDEVYGECKIGPYNYDTSRALAEIDPISFECGFADWLDSQLGETLWEINGEYTDENPEKNKP